jgi:beta-mannosidase
MMTGSLSLNGTWGLTWAEGSPLMHPDHYAAPELRGRKLLEARVPAPIHRVLMDAGLLEDPSSGLNSLKARWVEEQFWIYRHTFTVPHEAMDQLATLVFERLEYEATVLLNDEVIGAHANAFRPARFDVTGKLREGDNLLVVKLSTGMHSAADKPAAEYAVAQIELLTKRHWHRKPQYQSGWDWNARLMNVGILGDVCLEWRSAPRMTQVTVFAVPTDDLAKATVCVRATIGGLDEEAAGTLRTRVVETGVEAAAPITIPTGESRHEVCLELANPRLWWPINHGEQFLYTVEVTLEAGGETQTDVRRTGVRRIEMDQSPHPGEGRYCTLRVNNRPIFCKGGNWVPPDLLYSEVTAQRHRALVDLAVKANFSMLRVWGGAVYANHALCDACDEAGIMIWHDFVFACAKYPGDDPEFATEVRREAAYVVRELAHHPSLVVWCGNNEIEWGDWDWAYDDRSRTHPHYAIFHHDIPLIVRQEDPSTLHWMSSPWSPDYRHPNDPTTGDQHPWGVSILTPGPADWWKYRTFVDRFPNEGGVLGASSPATLRQFLPERERYLLSPSWDHHDNPLASMGSSPGEIGRAYATVELWTGRDPLAMDWEEYAFVSALMQAEGLQEYIANYRRRMFSSASAIFWMYNDSWPVTHGWTIVDHYLRKKLAYHPVRRVFQPVTVVVAEEDGVVTVYGINDTPDEWSGELRYGLFNLAGGLPVDERRAVVLPANASTPLASFERSRWAAVGLRRSGAFAQLLEGSRTLAQHRLFLQRFKELEFRLPAVVVSQGEGAVTLSCDVFAWGVCFDVDGELDLPDNCFDLLPGIPYVIPWSPQLGAPRVVRIGSRDAVVPAVL